MKPVLKRIAPASELPYRDINGAFRIRCLIPADDSIQMEVDENGIAFIRAAGGESMKDLVAGDNIEITRTPEGKIVISAVDTATDIAAGQNITIDIDPETGTAVINSITGGATNEHYQGVFDTAEDLIAFDTDPQVGDYGMIKNITYSDGGETTWNGQYKYCFYINGQWTVVDQMLTFTDDIDLLQQFYSVGGSSPVIYLHKIAQTGSFHDLRDVPIVATPEVTVEGTTVTVTCATEGAEIWYTTDGTMPHVNGNKYTGPINVTEATTFRFVGVKNGMINSLEATVGLDYELEPPTIDLDWHDGTVTMTNPNQSGTIYYTTDGSTPTNTSTQYTEPFVITEGTRFSAIVKDSVSGKESTVTYKTYNKATVNATLASRNINQGIQNILVTGNPNNATIYYTSDGTTPDVSSDYLDSVAQYIKRPIYGSPVDLKFRTLVTDFVPSDVEELSVGYAKPTEPSIVFDGLSNLVSINLNGETSVLAPSWPSSSNIKVYYTIDGSTPTKQSTLYKGPFAISGNVTVKAVLVAYGQYYSDVVTANIEITSQPTISLNSDTGDITITGPAGSTLYYTRDGSNPTTESTQYTVPFNVTNSLLETIKAIAVIDGQESGIATAEYQGLPWRGGGGNQIDYSIGKIYASPQLAQDGADVSYRGASGWYVYKQPIVVNLFGSTSGINPGTFGFKQRKRGYIPNTYQVELPVETTPDAPQIDYDEVSGNMTINLSGNTSEIPLQTNNNVPTMGARIYYTMDGSTPTAQNGTLYQDKPVPVQEGTTEIKSVTVCYGEFASDVTTEDISPEPSGNYMYFEAVEPNSTVAMMSMLETAPNLEYSTDGVNWQEWQHTTADGTHTFDTITLSAVGDRVYLRGDNPDGLAVLPEGAQNPNFSSFALTGAVNGGGNVMSLLDTTMALTVVPPLGFTVLFSIMGEGIEAALLTPPEMDTITTIGEMGCYGMYNGLTSLTAAANMSQLTTIGQQGCIGMYYGCTSLTAAANMSQLTTIGQQGCVSMYEGCTSLTAAADMPLLTTIGKGGCNSMYYGCTSLTAAANMPQLTTIGYGGCRYMYEGCISLTAAANLPQLTTIGDSGCYGMYHGCVFDMSSDGTTLNFDFPTPPITTTGADPKTYATAYNVADWMENTNGFTNP